MIGTILYFFLFRIMFLCECLYIIIKNHNIKVRNASVKCFTFDHRLRTRIKLYEILSSVIS